MVVVPKPHLHIPNLPERSKPRLACEEDMLVTAIIVCLSWVHSVLEMAGAIKSAPTTSSNPCWARFLLFNTFSAATECSHFSTQILLLRRFTVRSKYLFVHVASSWRTLRSEYVWIHLNLICPRIRLCVSISW